MSYNACSSKECVTPCALLFVRHKPVCEVIKKISAHEHVLLTAQGEVSELHSSVMNYLVEGFQGYTNTSMSSTILTKL